MAKRKASIRIVEREYPNGGRCHWCEKDLGKGEVLADLMLNDQLMVQVFTGRLFCTEPCWGEYLASEGFRAK